MYEKLVKLYNEGHSLRELADKFGVSHMQVKRILTKVGCELRDASEAQANFIKRNPDKHPTKGKPRTEAEKLKISETYTKHLEPEEKERRSCVAKERWNKLTLLEKQAIKKKTSDAFRATAKNGSALEKFLLTSLSREGFAPEFHKEMLIENVKMHIDIFLPQESVALEIDGPSHYEPIFGQEALEKTQHADTEKNGLLLMKGISVVRIKQTTSSITKYAKHLLVNSLKDILVRKPVKELIRLEI